MRAALLWRPPPHHTMSSAESREAYDRDSRGRDAFERKAQEAERALQAEMQYQKGLVYLRKRSLPEAVEAFRWASDLCAGEGEYRAYLPRARWVRDANDSYFAAMTYPQGRPANMQHSDIHDATWGVLSAVYGGAVHPSAEGHAVMADAAAPAAAAVLQLDAGVPEVTSQPVAPLPTR